MPEPDIDAIVRELERAQANYEAGRISHFDLMCIRSAHMPVILDALESATELLAWVNSGAHCGDWDAVYERLAARPVKPADPDPLASEVQRREGK